MSGASECSDCHAGFHIFKRKVQCGSCGKTLCSSCRSERKLCRRCEMLRDENVMQMTLQDLLALPVRDLKALQARLNTRVPDTVNEKDDLAKLVFQSILQRRQQMEERLRSNQQQQGPGPGQGPGSRTQSQSRPQSQSQQSSQLRSGGGFMSFMEELLGDGGSRDHQQRTNPSAAQGPTTNQSNAPRQAPHSNTQRPSSPQQQTPGPSSSSQPQQSSRPASSPSADQSASSAAAYQRLQEDRRQREEEQNARRAEAERARQEKAAVEIHLADIPTEADLSVLTVRQMKVLLHRNKVDYSMCVEREELHARVLQLWKDDQASKQVMEKGLDNDEDLCKICYDAPLNCVFLECGHLMSCIDCGSVLKECPICRNYITRRVHTFKA